MASVHARTKEIKRRDDARAMLGGSALTQRSETPENLGMRTSLGVAGDFPDVVAADAILGSSPQRLGIRD